MLIISLIYILIISLIGNKSFYNLFPQDLCYMCIGHKNVFYIVASGL